MDGTDQVSSKYGKLARVQPLLASCGIVAPILVASLVIVLGLLEPGYDHRTEMMSILGYVSLHTERVAREM